MIVFSKNDFERDGVSFLSFDDNFEFDNSNKIIFGFNGIGKTSIYNYLKKISNFHTPLIFQSYIFYDIIFFIEFLLTF